MFWEMFLNDKLSTFQVYFGVLDMRFFIDTTICWYYLGINYTNKHLHRSETCEYLRKPRGFIVSGDTMVFCC